jgi:cytidine deaminase
MNYKSLSEKAIEAKSKALPSYSNFHVGAALLTDDNRVYLGCNVEVSSYSLTICAERNAIFKAVSEGERKFKAIAIASDDKDFCPPCGACRQVISDLCGDIDVVMVNQKKELKILKLSELLPFAFGGEWLGQKSIRQLPDKSQK